MGLLCGVQLHTAIGVPVSKGIAAADKPWAKAMQSNAKPTLSFAEAHQPVSKLRLRSNIERH